MKVGMAKAGHQP